MTKVLPVESTTVPLEQADESRFHTAKILEIVGGHFIHDTYTAFISPVLPLLIEKLSLTLTQAGSLSIFLQVPSLLNVLIGYMADKISLHYFVIFAPAATATLVSCLGLAPSYLALAVLLFVAGISVAAFHVPAPAMIGQISGRQIGKGMGLFMAGGELGRTIGPLLVIWGIGIWGLDGIWRLAIIGWLTSAFLYWRLRNVSVLTGTKKPARLRLALPRVRRLFGPLTIVLFFRDFLVTSLSVFLVVLLEQDGYTLAQAGQALAIWSAAGIAGALMGGMFSDRIGSKRTIAIAIVSSAFLLLVLLNVSGWVLVPVLLALGFTSLSVTPVMQAIVQEYLVDYRAMANGLFMMFSFIVKSIATLIIGAMGDAIGLHSAFIICAILGLFALPLIYLIPDSKSANTPATD